tara:strand:+ start:88 stop:729 length:642 start_codon:yes stop_codon:yes gene_type:complete
MKLLDLYKQFGVKGIIERVFNKLISPIYKSTEVIVLFISKERESETDSSVKLMTNEKVTEWLRNNYINDSEAKKFINFLASECIGYYIEINNELAAWGFVQTKGTYKYGSYFYDLPESVYMLKNLFVKPNYRGLSLGKKINEARINAIPKGCIPCVFVIPENKYAIRNLKLYGFQEQLKISHTSWFKKYTYTRLQLIHDTKLNEIVIKGFKTL